MLRSISYISMAYFLIYIGGYLFHFIVSRKLGPVEYGKFIVLNSLFLTVGNLAGIYNKVSIKTLIEHKLEKGVFNYLRFISFFIGMFFFIVGFVFSCKISEFIRVNDCFYIVLIAFGWSFIFLLTTERAFLQSSDRFGIYSFSIMFELFLKFIIAITLLLMGYMVFGLLTGIVISLGSTILLLYLINKQFSLQVKVISIKKLIFLSLFASPIGFFIYVDDLFLRRIFEPHTAGLFASASIIGKAFIGFCLILMSVFFPKFVKLRYSKEISKVLAKYLVLVFVLFLFAELAVLTFGEHLFLILFGEKFVEGFVILPLYLLAVLPLVVSIIFMNLLVAVEKGVYLIYTHLVFYFLGFLLLPIKEVQQFVGYIFSVNLFFLILYGIFFMKRVKNL